MVTIQHVLKVLEDQCFGKWELGGEQLWWSRARLEICTPGKAA